MGFCRLNHIIGKLSFNKIKLSSESYVLFERIHSDFNKKIIEHENAQIEITNTLITGRIDFDDVFIEKINLEGSNVTGNGVVNKLGFVPKYANWETARLFKHEAIKMSNTIEALNDRAEERRLYSDSKTPNLKKLIKKLKTNTKGEIEKLPKVSKIQIKQFKKNTKAQIKSLKKKYPKKRTIRRFLSDRSEVFAVWLSKWSNDHGRSWLRAVAFTILCGVGFFGIFYLITCFSPDAQNISIIRHHTDILVSFTEDEYIRKDFGASLIRYYIPINYEGIIDYLEFSNANGIIKFFATLFYLSGKILMAYGMVQIVQSFRKLK